MRKSFDTPDHDKLGNKFEHLVGIEIIMDQLQIPRKTIYKWCYEHLNTGFPHYKVGRHLRFRLSEVEAWLRKYRWSGSI